MKRPTIAPVGWVIVDTQTGFYTPDLQQLATRIVDAIRHNPGPVWATIQTNPPSSPLRILRGWTGCATPQDQQLLPPIPTLNPTVIRKTGYNAAPHLPVKHLRNLSQVRLVGADTDACVLATALDLFDRGVSVAVVENLTHTTAGPTLHDAALAVLRRQLGPNQIITA